MGNLQSWQAIDVNLWVQAIFGCGNDVLVVIGGSYGIAIPLRPNIVFMACCSIPEDDSISSNLDSSRLLTNCEISAIVGKATLNTIG